jgi:iodotyrosine deiodinase
MKYKFEKLNFQRISKEKMLTKAESFYDSVKMRRTVRSFSDEQVDVKLIEFAVKTAGTAPSGANKQPWRFVIVKSPEIKKEIRIAAEKEEKENYEGRMPDSWLKDLEQFGTDWHKEFLEIAPYLIVVFKIDYEIEDEQIKKNYYVNDSVGIATGILLTALHNMGLATLTHTPSPMNFLRNILVRPKNEKPFMLIPVGYPADDCEVPVIKKKELEEIMEVV